MRELWNITFALSLAVATGCSKEEAAVDCSMVNLNFTTEVTDSECGLPIGTIQVTPVAGSAIIRYRLNEEPFQNSGTFPSLKPGFYTITVENSDGCSNSSAVLIRSGISYEESVKPIILTKCAFSGCHDGSGNIDFRVFDNLNPPDMKARTQTGNMPKTGSLTQEEIEAIACWADDGGLNN